ncbi:hypothetical protein FISHEDRAFT_50753 [Fistulina hepatica ATCC 64428]|uniref:NADH dehydrogenase [ubiquinone] iron-sulfur protein 4, mitochondrial n=1 Tax=Fistulina hepatica ATCC 64428 TaxID=1128425 RepID=A0A0D7A1R3_9AGAR|nr:hypothetical protein FISHEDRAFT_50753 [Fistulina hepatica ATCC 64428]
MSLLRASQVLQLSKRGVVGVVQASRAAPRRSVTNVPDTTEPSTQDDVVVDTTTQLREVLTADVISGAPTELRHRTVRIYKPTRNTMQSGPAKGERWRLDFDILEGGGRWENPLMGFASSADYVQALRMSFRTKEDAMHFAEKQGWDYYVQQPAVKRIPPKAYAENYLYRLDALRIHKTK